MGWTFYNSSGQQLRAAADKVATQAEMEAATSSTVFATPARTQYHPGVAKAHGTVTGGTLQSNSYNIASTSLDSTGTYTCNWDTDFANVNYASIMVVEAGANRCCTVDSPATGSVTCKTYIASSGSADSNNWQIAAFGDQ